jgi:hypothetical protein
MRLGHAVLHHRPQTKLVHWERSYNLRPFTPRPGRFAGQPVYIGRA